MFGVPQGSVLGPILFNLYTNDLQDQIYGSTCQYADDTTIYIHSKPSDISQKIVELKSHLNHLRD